VKRLQIDATERFWLRYTLVWGAAAGIVMVGGFAERWGDLPLMLFGMALATPAIVGPLVIARREPGALPLLLSVVAFALLLNYSQTPFFFDVLHAHYGFHVQWHLRGNPIFLYLMTIPYFATYCALLRIADRYLGQRVFGSVAACLVVALLETLLNATPLTRHLYCFDEPMFALGFGSLAYGISFVCILPVWRAADRLPLAHVLAGACAAVYVDSLALDALRYHVAPHLTHVDEGLFGLDRSKPSCLDVP
jgi:cycloeucalenol cycloisomerase